MPFFQEKQTLLPDAAAQIAGRPALRRLALHGDEEAVLEERHGFDLRLLDRYREEGGIEIAAHQLLDQAAVWVSRIWRSRAGYCSTSVRIAGRR